MAEEGEKRRSRTSMGVIKVIFWFLRVAGCVLVAVLIVRLVLSIGLPASIVSTPSTQNPVDLTLKAMNIILIFFSIVVAFLAFFGYKEVTAHQELREKLEKGEKNLKKHANSLERESKDRTKESRYMSQLNLVRIFYHLGVYDKASYVMQEIKESLTYEAPLFKGMISHEMGKYQDALRSLEEALHFDLEPKEKARVYFAKGKTYMAIGDYEKAESNYDKCLESAPDFLDAYVNKAHVCKRQSDFDGAIELINQAIRINDKDAQCYFNRACYHSLKDEKDKLEQDLRKAVELDKKWVGHALIDDDLAENRDIVKRILNL